MSHERLSEHDLRYGWTNPWIAAPLREKGITGLIHTLYQGEKGGSGDEMVTLGLFVVSSLGVIILISSVVSELKTTPTGPPMLNPLIPDKPTVTATAPKFETPVQLEEITPSIPPPTALPSPTSPSILSPCPTPEDPNNRTDEGCAGALGLSRCTPFKGKGWDTCIPATKP